MKLRITIARLNLGTESCFRFAEDAHVRLRIQAPAMRKNDPTSGEWLLRDLPGSVFKRAENRTPLRCGCPQIAVA